MLTELLEIAASQYHKCVVIATHNTDWIEKHAFDLVLLSKGVITANGTVPFYRDYKFREFRKEYGIFKVKLDQ